ncbi:hypothetical protein FQS90_09600 [Enterococcus casseliflavus]|uniref:hypothetical protein n=1 Tax=Enterococcus sp. 8E11_MSG4843 TaxID=1834190 RepID=UPI000B3ECCC1|nr:hypothetical protein [Enterococcus sp. 8E11_MSG4843]MBO1096776.1 hypothetical protein [Enterococcus casseliflavus]MBO1145098.1 hypothetical protein [Enterococcus casseliflavus]OUZ36761.1 hypothetical protein A5885_000949 [Enterococcus sp. 8E11_MSG4843]
MNKEKSGGLGFLSILTLIFVVAKLFGVIAWSWWLVFTPVLIGVGITILILIIAVIAVAVSD